MLCAATTPVSCTICFSVRAPPPCSKLRPIRKDWERTLDSLAFCTPGGRTCCLHPHVHCIVPAGGFSSDCKGWVRPKYAFFLPVAVLASVFRAKLGHKYASARRQST